MSTNTEPVSAPFELSLPNHPVPLDLPTEPSLTELYLGPDFSSTSSTSSISTSEPQSYQCSPQLDDSTSTIHTQTTCSSDATYLSIDQIKSSNQNTEEHPGEKSGSQLYNNIDLYDQKSPLLVTHPHIIYPANTMSETKVMETAQKSIGPKTKFSKGLDCENGQGLQIDRQYVHDLEHKPQQPNSNYDVDSKVSDAPFATCIFNFSAQPDKSEAYASLSLSLSSSSGKELLGETRRLSQDQQDSKENEDGGYTSNDDFVDSLAIGAERKRSTGERAVNGDTFCSAKKRRKGRLDQNSRSSSSSQTSLVRSGPCIFQFLEGQQHSTFLPFVKSLKESSKSLKWEFDPSTIVHSWSQPSQKHGKPSRTVNRNRLRLLHPNDSGVSNISFCQHAHTLVDGCQCRKRIFVEAIELSRPLSAGSRSTEHHPGWIESIKKRKIHQYPTKWTSTLSPSPYVKLMTIRDFWDVMKIRQDSSSPSNNGDMDSNSISNQYFSNQRSIRNKTVRQYPRPSQFLRGLWEEELRQQREQKMIPDTIRRPHRSKIFNSKPIGLGNSKPALPSLLSSNQIKTKKSEDEVNTVNGSNGAIGNQLSPPIMAEFDLTLKKKHRAAAIIRSHAIAEGSDMAEYKPWKDGTVIPQRGNLRSLKDLRNNIMDPWPTEESKSRDECTRILHRMREQLNIVINLQIHLRSMIKTAPTQWSFLLSIRHPAQVSIELLLALYGPHFMQTSNFRAIEQLLWGAKSQPQPQSHADTSTANTALLQT
ncbi:hypothetical protein BGZ49_010161 [Haplosporangium sp. Z 27]|nr:hypothetical protein BGZ49_010161 [Haplosporangium sp. Z 27]